MRVFASRIRTATAATALGLVLVGCGGSEPASTSDDSPASAEIEAAADEVADTAASAVDDAADAVEEVTDLAEEAAGEAAETVEDAVEEVTGEASDAADAATNDRVSAEVVAQYAALTGNAANGRRVFTQCMSCHAVQEGRNLAGPSLYGIVGREAGSIPGFRYSPANADSGITWTEETMFAYLEQPQAFIPGTFMTFPGLPKPQDRADVIAYLKEQAEQ